MVQAWLYNQLLKIRQYRPALVDQALEDLLDQQTELRWLVVVGAYLDEEINLGRAAELLNLHRLELQEQFLAQGIPLRLGVETVEEAQAEMAAISHWNTAAESAAESAAGSHPRAAESPTECYDPD
jgi:predicted HTH domain antitoxin